MTLRFARWLLRDAVVPRGNVESALVASTAGSAFVRTLLDSAPSLCGVLERRLNERWGPAIGELVPRWDVVARLPVGMCERLFGLPVELDGPESIGIAVVDPDDEHIAEEFGFHLGQAPRVVRAGPQQLMRALDASRDPESFRSLSQVPAAAALVGSKEDKPVLDRVRSPGRCLDESRSEPGARRKPLLSVPLAELPGEPAIPLVRRSAGARRGEVIAARPRLRTKPGLGGASYTDFTGSGFTGSGPRTRQRTAPGIGVVPDTFDGPSVGGLGPPLPRGERRPTVVPSPRSSSRAVKGPGMAEGGSESNEILAVSDGASLTAGGVVTAAEAAKLPSEDAVSERLGRAGSASALVEHLVALAGLVAARVLVFSVRRGQYEGYAGSANLEAPAPDATMSIEVPSVLRDACAAGYYLGPVPAEHAGLIRALGSDAAVEVYAVPITVGQKAALVLLASGLENARLGARWIDMLSRLARPVLEGMLPKTRRPSSV